MEKRILLPFILFVMLTATVFVAWGHKSVAVEGIILPQPEPQPVPCDSCLYIGNLIHKGNDEIRDSLGVANISPVCTFPYGVPDVEVILLQKSLAAGNHSEELYDAAIHTCTLNVLTTARAKLEEAIYHADLLYGLKDNPSCDANHPVFDNLASALTTWYALALDLAPTGCNSALY